MLDEASYTRWRKWPDLLGLCTMLVSSILVGPYWVLRASLCSDYQDFGRPYNAAVASDPWLIGFPCGESDTSNLPWQQGSMESSMAVSFNQPVESASWYIHRMWWALPYISLRYAFLHNGAWLFFMPVVVLGHLRAPRWWLQGGRTTCLVAWRLWTPIAYSVHVLLCGSADSPTVWDAFSEPAWGAARIVGKRGVWLTVLWPLHWRVTILEALLYGVSWLARHDFRPPSTASVVEFALGLSLGAFITIAISAAECNVFGMSLTQHGIPLLRSFLLLSLRVLRGIGVAIRAAEQGVKAGCGVLMQPEVLLMMLTVLLVTLGEMLIEVAL